MKNVDMDKIVNLCKQYGFIFQGSEIYGGLANTWDYGPLGINLKNNIKNAWRKRFIDEQKNAYELDSDILMHPTVWKASGHIDSFSDPLIDCKSCKTRHRLDNLIQNYDSSINTDKLDINEMNEIIKNNNIKCPKCNSNDFSEVRNFNLMFETHRGVTNDSKSVVYLRPENAQGEYVNFLNVQRSMRQKLPFSIGQIGKAFRNEITPGNFIFRTIEFEQMEFQTFCKKGEDEKYYNFYKEYGKQFYIDLGLKEENLRYHDHDKLAFYAKAACDIEYLFPFGWGEINGTHNRTDYDLKKHIEYSGKSLEYLDPDTNEKYVPYVVESTYGVGRTMLAILCEAYKEEILDDSSIREVLCIKPSLAPYNFAILPLIKKSHGEKAEELLKKLSKGFKISYDDTSNIGKRYRRQDIIGTPYCITVDDDTLSKNTVTVRDRDTMIQEVISVDDIDEYISSKIKFV
ncbi:MAG TPA: glycine--tRNA ligase [Bacilli bacterium]|nr:glycine--tRNA ligase [Bacilli bacterium]